MRPYKEGTPVYEIIRDGWSRDFQPTQTACELNAMGYKGISSLDVCKIWRLMTLEYEQHCAKENNDNF